MAVKKLESVNLKPPRPYDWGKWVKPRVASLRRDWMWALSAPWRLPILVLAGLRKCFIVFAILAISFYLFLGSGSVLATSYQKQQELTPLANSVVISLESALASIMDGETKQAEAVLATSSKQLKELQADFGGINLAASMFNKSKLGLTLLALRLGDEMIQGINAIAGAIGYLKEFRLQPALGKLDQAHEFLQESQSLLKLANFKEFSSGQIDNLNKLNLGLAESISLLDGIKKLTPLLVKLSGTPDPTKILILLQNTGEARATGGFIGVFALASFKNGELNKLSIHDSYDYDGRLFQEVKAPPFLRPYVNNIALRDSNHNPDFPTTARLASWFLEQEKGPTVDAVIAINESSLNELLKITGPIHLPGYQQVINADNFYLVLEYIIETNKNHPLTPKQVLIDLVDQIIARVGESPRPLVLLDSVLKLASTKHILLYSPEPILESEIDSFGTSGIFPPPYKEKQDFLSVMHTSLSGNKSDYFIDSSYIHTTFISRKGKLIDRLEIERRHHFSKDEESFLRTNFKEFAKEQRESNSLLLNTLGAGKNKDLVRVFVPFGSKLVSTHGVSMDEVAIRQDEDVGLTVFEFMQATDHGDTSKVALRYELPFYLSLDEHALYQLKFFHQPGQPPTNVNKEIVSSGQQLLFLNRQNELEKTSPYRETIELSQDHTFAIIVEQ